MCAWLYLLCSFQYLDSDGIAQELSPGYSRLKGGVSSCALKVGNPKEVLATQNLVQLKAKMQNGLVSLYFS